VNFSLKKRLSWSFSASAIMTLILIFNSYNFLNSLNKDIEKIAVTSNRVALLTDEIRISTVSILKYQRRILTDRHNTEETVQKLLNLCESITSQLQSLDSLYKDPEVNKVVTKMLSYVDSLKLVLGKSFLSDREGGGMSSIAELADKILDSFTEFQDIQYLQGQERDKKIKDIVNETKRNMMIVLIIGLLTIIILALIVPGKIALPFKKIKDAIRELQDCNFDVSIYYNQDDEIGEIAREMNKMIASFKTFEELRADRIMVENRKFDALANMSRKPVLVSNAEGRLMYMNSRLYSLLQVQTEDVIGKLLSDSVLPESIIEPFLLAIKRRSKLENIEIQVHAKVPEQEIVEGGATSVPVEVVEPELIFEGFANVIPVRGKESNLDYYLMIISTEVSG